MGLFGLFSNKNAKDKNTKDQKQSAPENEQDSLYKYSGMRVEVLGLDNQLLFVARLVVMDSGRVELHKVSGADVPFDPEPMTAYIMRGYDEKEQKAIRMHGVIVQTAEDVWHVERLNIVAKDNDRAFFRMGTNTEGEIMTFSHGSGKGTCEVVNISAGGVCIRTDLQLNTGDKLLVKFKLLPDSEPVSLMCDVRRITPQKMGFFEYGCKFFDLEEATVTELVKAITELQIKKRHRYER